MFSQRITFFIPATGHGFIFQLLGRQTTIEILMDIYEVLHVANSEYDVVLLLQGMEVDICLVCRVDML